MLYKNKNLSYQATHKNCKYMFLLAHQVMQVSFVQLSAGDFSPDQRLPLLVRAFIYTGERFQLSLVHE